MTLAATIALITSLITVTALAGMVHHLSRQLRDLDTRQRTTSLMLGAHIAGAEIDILTWPTRKEPHE